MAFGNPYNDPWDERTVAIAARAIADIGIPSVSIADTVGTAEPEQISRVVAAVMSECPSPK